MRTQVVLVLSALILTAGLTAAGQAAETPGADPAALAVVEITVGTGYDRETRSLTGVAEVFPAGTEQLWCRTRITGAETPTTVTHVWYHRDQTLARVELQVGSADWRTFSSKNLLPDWTGPWEVKVLDEAGNVLQSVQFTVE